MRLKLNKLELIDEASIDALSHDELITLAKTWHQRLQVYQNYIFKIRKHIYGSRSEKSKKDDAAAGNQPPVSPKERDDTIKLTSGRYPDATKAEDKIEFAEPPICKVCGHSMEDSGMTEDSEYLDVKTKEFIVVQQKRQKCRCKKCHGAIVTAPPKPRVTPSGSYSDELIVDATLSKFCDLIPMERYCKMAERGGLAGLPPHSLIQNTFKLADFLKGVYEHIRFETLNSRVLMADETTHRMLEGDKRQRWYLWNFSNQTATFFEAHDTRSGDVSTEILLASTCEVLLTDAYSAYGKSIAAANEIRVQKGLTPIESGLCNAHARREFRIENEDKTPIIDAVIIEEQYKQIYKLNSESKGLSDIEVLAKRAKMRPHFEIIKNEAQQKIDTYSSKSSLGRAYNYFLKHLNGLTLFLTNPDVSIDNNQSERTLRSHVVGRKTWYGTHSREGATVAATHFTIVETCKMNGVNPRKFYLDAIDRIHSKLELLTPYQYKKIAADSS